MDRLLLFTCYSLFPLLTGLIIYLCVGSSETILYKLYEDIIGASLLTQIRSPIAIPSFIKFHLADGLWAFALTSTLCTMLFKELTSAVLLSISIIAVSVYELLQFFGFIRGTWDIMDLGFMIICALLAHFIIINKLKHLPCDKQLYS